VRGAPPDKRDRKFDQDRSGLHHFCFRARDREQIDAIYEFVRNGARREDHPSARGGEAFAPGYYSLLFEDPDGIRVEVNHVPGKGHFDKGGRLGEGGAGPSTGLGRLGRHGGDHAQLSRPDG
jgi:hypothetical protein